MPNPMDARLAATLAEMRKTNPNATVQDATNYINGVSSTGPANPPASKTKVESLPDAPSKQPAKAKSKAMQSYQEWRSTAGASYQPEEEPLAQQSYKLYQLISRDHGLAEPPAPATQPAAQPTTRPATQPTTQPASLVDLLRQRMQQSQVQPNYNVPNPPR